jgi:hypothetical protein
MKAGQDDIEIFLLREGNSVREVPRNFHIVSLRSEEAIELDSVGTIIVDYQDATRFSHDEFSGKVCRM